MIYWSGVKKNIPSFGICLSFMIKIVGLIQPMNVPSDPSPHPAEIIQVGMNNKLSHWKKNRKYENNTNISLITEHGEFITHLWLMYKQTTKNLQW